MHGRTGVEKAVTRNRGQDGGIRRAGREGVKGFHGT